MNHTIAANFRQAYFDVADDLRRYGKKVQVQGGTWTRELIGYRMVLEDPTHCILSDMGRNPNNAIGAAEAAQLIGGVSDPALMVRITKNFARFLDAGIFHGAYGPRVKTQLPAVIDRLKQDSSSRQALLNIWRPQDDLFEGARDLPCTLTLQFLIREDKLHAVVNMRSNDVYWGLTYDAFQFTQLQCTLANILGVGPGTYTHIAGSMHMYERDLDAIQAIVPAHDQGQGVYGFNDLSRARKIIEWAGNRDIELYPETETEHWYMAQLNKFRP